MPFKETSRMEERIRMLLEYESGNWSVSELCRRHGVCRDTFYEWRKRKQSGDPEWFRDGSHAPLQCWQTTDQATAAKVIAARRRFPYLGPRKLLARPRSPRQQKPRALPLTRPALPGDLSPRMRGEVKELKPPCACIAPVPSAFARNARATISLWRDRVRYRRALAVMSERDLADIGVGRSQIAEEVSKPFWRA